MNDMLERLQATLADRYRIDREVGAGGMATVFLAQDLKHDRRVAIKVLRRELAAVIAAERFLREIKTIATLQHPHILGLIDSGEVIGTAYYVMPFLEGGSLRNRLDREKQLPLPDVIRIVTEVASALDYAHRHGVIHRDIKPENILLHDGSAMVADFGIALAVSTAVGRRMTETDTALGTPHYMSPEQATGQQEISPRSDVYALGTVTYEMLIGEPPFTGPTPQAILSRVLTADPPTVTGQRRTVSPEMEAAVLTALEKLPADRFPTAGEFATALATSHGTLRVTPRSTGVRAAIWRPSRRPAQLLSAALVIVTGLALWGWLRAGAPQTVARHRIELGVKGYGISGSTSGATLSPDGETIVFRDTVGGVVQLWSKDRNQLDALPLAGTMWAAGAPFVSPDGEWLGFVTREGWLRKVPRRGGTAIKLAEGANTGSTAGAWLSDGTILFNTTEYSLAAVADTGGPVRLLENKERLYGVVAMTPLPNARGALYTLCTAYCATSIATWLIELPSGTMGRLLDETVRAWYLPDGRLIYVRRDGGVYVARLDLRTRTVAAAGLPVIEGVRTDEVGIAFMQLSASGSLLYATGRGELWGPSRVLMVDRTGAATTVDSAWSPILGPRTMVSLAPNGRSLAVTVQSDSGGMGVWVKELDRGPVTRLAPDAEGSISATWTPDGRSLTMFGDSGGTLRIRPADGSAGPRTLLQLHGRTLGATWSPDGRWLVGSSTDSGRTRLWTLRPGDSIPSPLADTAVNNWAPALSPDGRWLAYVSDESGRAEVYVRPFPNANTGKWQISKEGGQEPLWAHSGRELFYRFRPDFGQPGDPLMMAATVITAPKFSIVRQQALFVDRFRLSPERRFYDITPDDRHFVMVSYLQSRGRAPLNLVMVENWTGELSQVRR